MKLTYLVTLAATVAANNFGDRYIMDDPICPDVDTCRDITTNGMKCRGFHSKKTTGRIRLQAKHKLYSSTFNCRWEIEAPKGYKVRIKITQGHKKFGIEHHKNCGFDRLHIQSNTGERFGRLCSNKMTSGETYNGLSAPMSFNGEKIESFKWQDWITLPTNHLVIGFDSDRLNEKNRGFRLVYETYKDHVVPNVVKEEIKNLKSEEQALMNQIFSPEDKWFTRIGKKVQDHYDQIFEKWHACGGASMDPNYNMDSNFERNNNVMDKTAEIQALYKGYRDFIDTQLTELGTCKRAQVAKIIKKKDILEKMFINGCKKVGKCL